LKQVIVRNYKIIGIISFLVGALYTVRAFLLIRAPGELPVTNTYPFVIGILLCLGALGVYIFGEKLNEMNTGGAIESASNKPPPFGHLLWEGGVVLLPAELLIALLCFVVFTLTFEKIGTVKASFMFSFILGSIWNRNIPAPGEAARRFSFFFSFSQNHTIGEDVNGPCRIIPPTIGSEITTEKLQPIGCSFIECFTVNKIRIVENIVSSCICALGIWLVYTKIFNLSLP
jgi:hypothetical protein